MPGVTGGLAAPLVAAGASAVLGAGGAAALGSATGIAIMASLFGAAGAGLTGQILGQGWHLWFYCTLTAILPFESLLRSQPGSVLISFLNLQAIK